MGDVDQSKPSSSLLNVHDRLFCFASRLLPPFPSLPSPQPSLTYLRMACVPFFDLGVLFDSSADRLVLSSPCLHVVFLPFLSI
jgi:hypothetical protein